MPAFRVRARAAAHTWGERSSDRGCFIKVAETRSYDSACGPALATTLHAWKPWLKA